MLIYVGCHGAHGDDGWHWHTSVAGRTVAAVQHRGHGLSKHLSIGTGVMPETNLWPGWRSRAVNEPVCCGSVSKDANIWKVQPWYLL